MIAVAVVAVFLGTVVWYTRLPANDRAAAPLIDFGPFMFFAAGFIGLTAAIRRVLTASNPQPCHPVRDDTKESD
jgi:hypothetical protein